MGVGVEAAEGVVAEGVVGDVEEEDVVAREGVDNISLSEMPNLVTIFF